MKNILRTIAIIAVILIIVFGAYYLQTLLAYILLAAILSLLGRPIMNFLKSIKIGKFHIPTPVCGFLTLFSFFLVFGLFIYTIVPPIITEISHISNIDTESISTSFSTPLSQLDTLASKYQLDKDGKSFTEQVQESIVNVLNINNVSNVFTNIFGSFFGILGNTFAALFSIFFITYFFLTEESLLYNVVKTFVPREFENSFEHVASTSKNLITRYFIGVFIQIILFTTLITIGMLLFGVKYALTIGFFAGLVNIIPYVGPLIGMAFGILIALATTVFYGEVSMYTDVLPLVIKVAAVFLTVQVLDNVFFQPYIFSNSIKAHPLEIFLLISIAATFAGIAGMIFCIPVYTVLRVIAAEVFAELGLFGMRR